MAVNSRYTFIRTQVPPTPHILVDRDIRKVFKFSNNFVIITGNLPLLAISVADLHGTICPKGHSVNMTSPSHDINKCTGTTCHA